MWPEIKLGLGSTTDGLQRQRVVNKDNQEGPRGVRRDQEKVLTKVFKGRIVWTNGFQVSKGKNLGEGLVLACVLKEKRCFRECLK